MDELPIGTDVIGKFMNLIPGNSTNQEKENEELSFEDKLRELSEEMEEEEFESLTRCIVNLQYLFLYSKYPSDKKQPQY